MSPFRFPSEEPSNLKYRFGDKINNEDISNSQKHSPLFCYNYIDLDQTEYNFNQDCLDSIDAKFYFKRVKQISQKLLEDSIDNSSYKDHFRIYNSPNKKMKDLFKKISGSKYVIDEQLPSFGEFALYTDEEGLANRAIGKKSPRIHFFIGPYGIIYILFYDPYHEIFPTK
jgi:hypothetical protein